MQSQARFNRVSKKVPEKVPEEELGQVRTNRVPEKVPEKVWEVWCRSGLLDLTLGLIKLVSAGYRGCYSISAQKSVPRTILMMLPLSALPAQTMRPFTGEKLRPKRLSDKIWNHVCLVSDRLCSTYRWWFSWNSGLVQLFDVDLPKIKHIYIFWMEHMQVVNRTKSKHLLRTRSRKEIRKCK